MPYDLAENKMLTDWLRGRGGFRVGLAIGGIVTIIWLAISYASPLFFVGEWYGFAMATPVPIAAFIAAGVIWGLLFRLAAGVTWLFGCGLVFGICAGMSEGLAASLGWSLDWGFNVKTFYNPIDVEPQGLAVGVVKALIHAGAGAAATILGAFAATVASTLFIRRFVAKRMRHAGPRLVARFPVRARQVIDPGYRYGGEG
ncbi:MAG: hypothetical protein OXG33_12855 [Chloroflexi bacterium]|nr:hypothetical protein [Chloroflexota bacterium]